MDDRFELSDFIQSYNELFLMPFPTIMEMLLNSLGIKTEADIDSKFSVDDHGFIGKNQMDMGTRILYHVACYNAIEEIERAHSHSSKLFFHNSLFIGEDTNYLNTYVALFPERFIAYTSDLYIHQDIGVEGAKDKLTFGAAVGTDLLRQYLRHRELIASGLLHLFPQSVFPIDKDYVSIPNFKDDKNALFIGNASHKLEIIPRTDHIKLVMELPWLKGAQIEDFIEIREKYKTEYERFQIKTDELLLKAKDGEEIESLLAKEYNEASLEIRNIMNNRKSELKRKGKEVLLGTICTAIPIVLSNAGFNLFDPKIFSSIIGGGTIYNGIKDYFVRGHLERDNPYWILYEWQQKSPFGGGLGVI